MRVENDKDTRSPGKSTRMFNTNTDASLAARIQQTIQERRMYLSQQRYIREAERTRNQGAANNDHSRSISSGNEFQDRVVQYSSQNAQSFQPLTSTQDNLSRMTSVNQPVQGTSSISSNYVSRPSGVTPNNRETVSTDQLDLRHELLMEVISQFEKKISDQQNKSFEYSKRRLNSNNGVAFDWGKLPRIGSVHSVQGIIGPKKSVQTSPVEAEESTSESVSRMGNIKMAELARLILNGAFDYYLNPSSPKNVADTTDKAVGVSSNPTSQGNENDSNQESVTQNQVYDPRGGSSSQHLSVSSAPSKGDYPYLDDRQLELIAKQLIASFNQTHPQATTTPSSNASDPCFSSGGGYPQSNQRAIYNTNYDHSSVSQGQPPGVYGRTPVQTTYPRTQSNVAFAPRNNGSYPHIRHFLTSSPMAASTQQAAGGTNGQRQRGFSHNHRNTLPVINRSVRTARVEPLNIHTNYLQPISLAAGVNTSSTSNSPGSQQLVDIGNVDHDTNSCLDCKLLGTCPIMNFIEAESIREKEKNFDDSSPNDEEPELIITKVTTKDAERGPIERIDVDEWVSSSASPSEAVRVKQEPVDKEEEVTFHEEKSSDIENTVNQMRLVAEKILNEDNASDSTNFDKNEMERSCIDTDLNANSSQDSITDSNIVDREFTTVSEGPLVQDSTSDNDNDCTIVDRQTACEIIEECIQGGVTDDVTVRRQTTPEITVESSAQNHTTIDTLRLTSSEITDVQPVADICKSSRVLNESDEAATAETPAQTGYGSPGSETGTNENASTSAEDDISSEANFISLDQESRPLIALMKKVTSLEQYLGVSIQSTVNKNPAALGIEEESNLGFTPEKEYDKGDRNYEKYVTMEGEGICDQVHDKTVTRRESNDGCRRPSQTTSRQSTRPVEMSLQDKETVERLEKALELNQQKLKNQNVLWIRHNSLKARLKILKRIEKILQKYDYPSPAEESPINENLETRSIPGDLLNTGGVENAASRIEGVPPAEETYAPLTNPFLGKEKDRERKREISDSREMLRSTSEETCLLRSPEEMEFDTYKNLKPESQDRFDEAVGKEPEEVIAGEEQQLNDNGTSVENEVADLDNGKHQDPEATVVSEERQSVVDPPNAGVLENIVTKSEGEQYSSNTESFSLEDAIKTFAEMPQDLQDENPEEKESASQTSEEEPIPLEDENQENLSTISPPEHEEPFQTDNLIFNEFQEQVTRQLPKESLSLTNDETFESMRIREHDVQTSEPSKGNNEIHDLSNESPKNNLEINALNELSPSPISSSPLFQGRGIVPRPSSTNQFKDENFSFDDNAKSPSSADKPTLYTCVRKGKRKSDDTEVHVPIKKEKVEANQENSPKEEKSNNIWDILMSKYSH